MKIATAKILLGSSDMRVVFFFTQKITGICGYEGCFFFTQKITDIYGWCPRCLHQKKKKNLNEIVDIALDLLEIKLLNFFLYLYVEVWFWLAKDFMFKNLIILERLLLGVTLYGMLLEEWIYKSNLI